MLILINLCSCASRAVDNRLYTYLTDRARFVLLPPGAIEKPMDMAQFISASFMGQNYYFKAWVRADETGMDMTLLNDLGVVMGDLSYVNGLINFSSRVLPGSVQPEYIVADFQLCFYDPVLLRRALEESGLSLEIQGNTRRIFDGRNLIVEIEKTHNKVGFVNHLRGYAYTLEGDFE
jgi:hypothetical protein